MHRVLMVVGICLLAVPALAQDSRVTIAAGASAQSGSESFTDVSSFPYFVETARTEGSYRVDDGVAFDIGGIVSLWRGLGVGLAATRLTRDTEADVSGSFPHPFFFNANRTGAWPQASLDRTELGFHVSAAYQIVNAPRLVLSIFGGPSFFSFEQGVVDDIAVIETYPYDSIDARLTTGTIDGSALGYHAGADLGFFFTRNIGVGGVLRFTNATKNDVRIGNGEPFDLEIGGIQAGGGLRLRF
jgi:hypothetical protein